MRQLRLLLFLICSVTSYSQDTIYGNSQRFTDSVLHIPVEAIDLGYYAGCAHGHECCSSGCRCCPELNRAQRYDTIFYPNKNDVQRIAVVERYFFALTNELLPVHYRFRKKGEEWSQKYYRADLGREGSTRWGDGWMRYPEEDERHYQQMNRALVVDETGDYSMIDLQGNKLEVPFHINKYLGNGVYLSCILVNDTYIYGFSDGKGHKIGPLKYANIGVFNDQGIAIATVNNRFGNWHSRHIYLSHVNLELVNCAGEIVFPCTYLGISEIGPDRYLVSREDGAMSIINAAGKVISKNHYRQIYRYSEGLVFAHKNDSVSVFIDMDGQEVIHCKYDQAHGFQDGVSAVMKNKKWGFIDKTGKLVIPLQFDQVTSFYNGVVGVAIGDHSGSDEWRLIDKTGKYISNKVYDEIYGFRNGLARAWINGEGMTLIDTKGKEIFPCKYGVEGYGSDNSWYVNGLMIRSTVGKQNTLEVINEREQRVIDLSDYVSANFIRDGSAFNEYRYYPFILVHKKDYSITLIDFDGRDVLKETYKNLTVSSDSVAVGYLEDKVHIIDLQTGKTFLTYELNQFVGIDRGIIKLKHKTEPYRYEYVNLEGKPLEGF